MGLCGTSVSKPPAIMAIPKLIRTWRVKKASEIASTGGTMLYHRACWEFCAPDGAEYAAIAQITPKMIAATAPLVRTFNLNGLLFLIPV